jgi:phospholipase C
VDDVGDVRTGQAFMADVVHAFMESPQWERGALFIVYDEWGEFFDHVAPPRVPDDRNDPDIDKDFGLMGFRILAIAVSPWVRRGHVAHSLYGFESILKFIEYRFGLPSLTRRDANAGNIGRSFDWSSKPRLDLPDLPRPEHVLSMPCAGTLPGGVRAKDHDALDLVSSGYLERMGFSYAPATPTSTFREPSKVLQARVG